MIQSWSLVEYIGPGPVLFYPAIYRLITGSLTLNMLESHDTHFAINRSFQLGERHQIYTTFDKKPQCRDIPSDRVTEPLENRTQQEIIGPEG